MKEKHGLHFGWVSIVNHWAVAVVFISVLCLGFYLDYVGSGRAPRGPLMGAHIAGGLFLFGIACWRIVWRLAQGFPKDVAPMPLWQRLSAKAVHLLLLLVIVVMPISGILMTLFGERGINVLGLFTIPAQADIEAISQPAYLVHEYLAYIFLGILALHVGAVLKHHYFDKDATLKRMLRVSKES